MTLLSTPAAWLRAGDFVAYSTGFSFETWGLLELADEPPSGHLLSETADTLLNTLQIGLGLAGGRELTMAGEVGPEPPDPPALSRRRHLQGGGRYLGWRDFWWLWPLPPAGPILLICSWEAMGVAPSESTFDSGPLLEGARSALRYWE